MDGLKNQEFRRLAKLAGVIRMSKSVYENMRGHVNIKLNEVMGDAVEYMQYAKRRTMSVNYVVPALPVSMYSKVASKTRSGSNRTARDTPKLRRSRPGVAAARDVRAFQKTSSCLFFSKAAFLRAVVQYGRKHQSTEIRFSSLAVLHIQYYIEHYVVSLFQRASMVASHTKQLSVFSRDIDAVVSLEHRTDGCAENHGVGVIAFGTYINRVLKQVHPDISISTDVSSQVNQLLNTLAQAISRKAQFLCSGSIHAASRKAPAKSKKAPANSNKAAGSRRRRMAQGKMTIGSREIMIATRFVLREELSKVVVDELTKAVTKFSKTPQLNLGKGVKTSRSKQAGLTFSVSAAEHVLRATGVERLSASASVALAAVLEHICVEVVELSGLAAQNRRRSTLKARHLFLAIASDGPLSQLCKNLGWIVLGGGVVPGL